ncbi:MAG: helix-turn-helix domain-containing protein [Pseudomonadota bacterium]
MFDTTNIPEDDRLDIVGLAHALSVEAFCDLAHDFEAPVPIYTDLPHFGPKGTQWSVGDMLFTKTHWGSYTFSRTQHGVQDYGHLVALERHVSGELNGIYDDEPFNKTAGNIAVSDLQTTAHGFYLDLHTESVFFPKARLGFEANARVPNPDISPDTLIGKIVFAEWEDVFHALQRGDQYLSAKAVDRLIACLKIATGTHPQREDVRAQARIALFRQICRHIDAQLDKSDVTLRSLLRDFGVSRAGLYRMFDQYGGVRNYITMRRAVRALLSISRRTGERGAVSAAVERWGFSTAPNFNRTVKRLYGTTPGAFFQAPPKRQAPMSQGGLLVDRFMEQVAT